MHEPLFITGMARSGTTLVDKILGGFEKFESFSQPLPLLLAGLKADFLRVQGVSDHRLKTPLSDQQFENFYNGEDFADFLESRMLCQEGLAPILTAMVDYSGQYFKPEEPLESLRAWDEGTLSGYLQHYFKTHQLNAKKRIAWKETLAEEFIPYLTGKGFFVLLILRDPRDVVASLVRPGAEVHAGSPRPVLWAARQWRKSVAYSLRYSATDDVRSVRYEDLVSKVEAVTQEWADWLGAKSPDNLTQLLDREGRVWPGNSSFAAYSGISEGSVGQYTTVLSPSLQSFVEALCYSEMKALGYRPTISLAEVEDLLRAGPPEDFLERDAFAYYAYSEKRQDEELRRWRALLAKSLEFDPAFFVFERSLQTLHRAVQAQRSCR